MSTRKVASCTKKSSRSLSKNKHPGLDQIEDEYVKANGKKLSIRNENFAKKYANRQKYQKN